MRLIVTIDTRLERTPDGSIWVGGAASYPFWTRYLEVFEEVRVVARVRAVQEPSPDTRRLDGPRVSVLALPFYAGPWQYLRRRRALQATLRSAVGPDDAALLRVPGTLSTGLAGVLRAQRRPYAVEVIGDPYHMFAPGSVRSILRPILRWWIPRQLGRQCREACAASYVTADFLQRRYPPSPSAYTVTCSSIDLTDEALAAAPRPIAAPDGPLRLVFVGSLAQLHKAVDILIRAVAENLRGGLALDLQIVGDGKHRPEFEMLARALGITQRVQFVGQVRAGDGVRDQLDQADLFVLPSRTEGLPRVLVEAMARGLPCIATRVGGVPELLAGEDTVPPGDQAALATAIRAVAKDPARRQRMAARNLARARDYHAALLAPRRRAFYQALRERTEQWLHARTSG